MKVWELIQIHCLQVVYKKVETGVIESSCWEKNQVGQKGWGRREGEGKERRVWKREEMEKNGRRKERNGKKRKGREKGKGK